MAVVSGVAERGIHFLMAFQPYLLDLLMRVRKRLRKVQTIDYANKKLSKYNFLYPYYNDNCFTISCRRH